MTIGNSDSVNWFNKNKSENENKNEKKSENESENEANNVKIISTTLCFLNLLLSIQKIDYIIYRINVCKNFILLTVKIYSIAEKLNRAKSIFINYCCLNLLSD